jgi:hypothetical protein
MVSSFLAGAYLDHCDAKWEAIESEQAQVQVHKLTNRPLSTEQMPACLQ